MQYDASYDHFYNYFFVLSKNQKKRPLQPKTCYGHINNKRVKVQHILEYDLFTFAASKDRHCSYVVTIIE